MKLIPLTKGKFAQIDDEDYSKLNSLKWQAKAYRKNKTYAARTYHINEKWKTIGMHRIILQVIDTDILVDHIDGNGLNNQKSNLRTCTVAENRMNSTHTSKKCTSDYKGVSWNKGEEKWAATIKYKQKTISLGYFDTEAECALAYNLKAQELFGNFALLNNIPEGTKLSKFGKNICKLVYPEILKESANYKTCIYKNIK